MLRMTAAHITCQRMLLTLLPPSYAPHWPSHARCPPVHACPCATHAPTPCKRTAQNPFLAHKARPAPVRFVTRRRHSPARPIPSLPLTDCPCLPRPVSSI
ncbi:MAG: hypothetical protein J3K34DRAFT_400722 [Monoraphidium minutum]|nr:MAG: hypothetical protein J3K34DRAFT_400722 [Monoraphidium minutum]